MINNRGKKLFNRNFFRTKLRSLQSFCKGDETLLFPELHENQPQTSTGYTSPLARNILA